MEEAFYRRAERLSAEFCARYGVTTAWSDEQIERALADHGLPKLEALPAEPRGIIGRDETGP